MKLLFLTQLFPIPPNSGGKIISNELINALSTKYELFIFCFCNDNKYKKHLKKYKSKCKKIYVETRSIVFKNYPLQLISQLLLSFLTNHSFLEYKYYSDKMKVQVESIIIAESISTIFVDHDSMFQYVPKWFKGKVIYNAVDITSHLYHQFAKIDTNPIKKILYTNEAKKLEIMEKKIYSKSDLIFTVSLQDKDFIIKLGYSKNKINLLQIPFQINNLYKNQSTPTILFIGLLTWKPNKDGISWFLNEVFPQIINKCLNCKLIIAGYGVEQFNKYVHLYPGHIKLIKNVEQNKRIILDLYRKSSLFIIPIRMGSGIRVKLLDALAHGIPIVSTSNGAEGIISYKNNGIIYANDNESFAKIISKIITHKQKLIDLSTQGLNFIKCYYNKKNLLLSLDLIEKIKNNDK